MGDSFSAVVTVKNYHMPGYSTFDMSTGLAKDAWNVQFFVQKPREQERQYVHQLVSIHRHGNGDPAENRRCQVRL